MKGSRCRVRRWRVLVLRSIERIVSRVEEGSASLREMNSGIRRDGLSVCFYVR